MNRWLKETKGSLFAAAFGSGDMHWRSLGVFIGEAFPQFKNN